MTDVWRQIKAHLAARGIKMVGLNQLKKEDLVGLLDTVIAKAEQQERNNFKAASQNDQDSDYGGDFNAEQALQRMTMDALKEVRTDRVEIISRMGENMPSIRLREGK